MLDRKKIDWRRNPVGTAESIDHNFNVLFNAFENLMNERFETVTLKSMSAERIFSGSSDLSSLFAPKSNRSFQPGINIGISEDPHNPIVSVSKTPSFERIYSGDTDLSSIFISKADVRETMRPDLGLNLLYTSADGALMLEMAKKPKFEGVETIGISADTAQFDNILYKGRPLDELLPSHQLPDDAPYLVVKKVDWGKNPIATGNDINENFNKISRAFNTLLQHKLSDVSLGKVVADDIILSGNSISDLFLAKNAHHDIVRIQAGSNLTTGGTQNRPVVSVSNDPVFSSITASIIAVDDIMLEGKNILDVLYTRKEAMSLSYPSIGKNLGMERGKDEINTLNVIDNPAFESMASAYVTANTITTSAIVFRGSPIEQFFGSHTFVKAGKNVMTGGTKHDPIVSTVDDPSFVSVRSEYTHSNKSFVDDLTGSTSLFNSMVIKNDLNALNMLLVDSNRVSIANNMHLIGDRVTIGGAPEMEVSSFLRTKVRILATQSSPIHYALIIQKKEHEPRRLLNDGTVDFVVRGDGNVGIGAFVDISSKLTIKGDNGAAQLRLATPFTPTGTNDENGKTGNIAWDDDYVYVKTEFGWGRAALEQF